MKCERCGLVYPRKKGRFCGACVEHPTGSGQYVRVNTLGIQQNGYVDFKGEGCFSVGIDTNHRISIQASAGDFHRKGVHHYFQWQGISIDQAIQLGKTLLTAADDDTYGSAASGNTNDETKLHK